MFKRNKRLRREELAELVCAYQSHIFRYLRYLGVESSLREDLVQETFLVAMRSEKIRALDSPARRAYLLGIARNLNSKAYTRRKRDPLLVLSITSLEQADSFWSKEFLRGSDGFDYVEALRECCQSLPPRQNELLIMQYTNGKSRLEISEAMGLSPDGVKALARRIRGALRRCIHRRLRLESGS